MIIKYTYQQNNLIPAKRKGYKLASQNGLALMFWRNGNAAKGERPIHEVYKLAQDGESLDAMLTDWYKDLICEG